MIENPTGRPITSSQRSWLAVRLQAVAVVTCAVLVKLALIWHVGGRVYPDTIRAINFGHLFDRGVFDLAIDGVVNKTFVGPVLWFYLYSGGGMFLIKALNLLMFVGLCIVHYRLGRPYSPRVRLTGLVILAFYVGTNRNVAAGEPDDMMSALLLSAGVLAYLDSQRAFTAGLLMGLEFLFKFSAAIFIGGFGLYLVLGARWRDAMRVAIGASIPYAAVIAATGFGSLYTLQISLVRQRGYSTWTSVLERLFSTGAIPAAAVAALAWFRNRTSRNTLFFVLSTSYIVYMIVNRDAFAAGFVMMQCLVFSSFLIAEFLLGAEESKAAASVTADLPGQPSRRRLGVAALLGAYVVAATVVSYVNLYRDAAPVVLVRDEFAARRMFPWNFRSERYR